MPRLKPPSDDFEAEELDFPVFEPPARRATDGGAAPKPRRQAAKRAETGAKPRPATRNRLEEFPAMEVIFEPEFEDEFPPIEAPKPVKRRATKSGPAPVKVPARPQTRRPSRGTDRPVRHAPRGLRTPKDWTPIHFEVIGIAVLAVALFLGYNTLRPAPEQAAVPQALIYALRRSFGLGAYLLPFAFAWVGGLLFFKRQEANLRPFLRNAGLGFLLFLTAAHLFVPRNVDHFTDPVLFAHGGVLGGGLALGLRTILGEAGSWIVLAAGTCITVLIWTQISLSDIIRHWQRRGTKSLGSARQDLQGRMAEKAADRAARRAEREAEAEYAAWEEGEEWEEPAPQVARRAASRRVVDEAFVKGREEPAVEFVEDFPLAPAEDLDVPPVDFDAEPDPVFVTRAKKKAAAPVVKPPGVETPVVIESEFPDEATPEVDPDSTIDAPRFLEEKAAEAEETGPRIEILDAPPPPSVVDEVDTDPAALAHAALHGNNFDDDLTPMEALERQAAASAMEDEEDEPLQHEPDFFADRPRRRFGDGPYMPVYFDESVRALDPPVPPDLAGVEEDIQKGVQAVQETLGAFKIDARVTDVKRGPVITRYEVQPAPGVRVASIANLDRDLARSLSALAVRIEAPVPGKNVVGIEVPNKRVHLVRMRDVLEQPDFLSHQSKLAFVLGKDIAGQPKWADLTKMPHMLIAGATNSGKSVCLNSIIASILVRAAPDEVRFSLIDPKRVELTLYRGIPHLMHDVVVEPKQAVTALRRAIEEMDRRYKLFATRGVRNIASYNAKLNPGEKPMPYIVIVIDELADLMMTAAAEFEKLICRLAQLARATGIHLIVATQRPSVNVITGVIKANIPARVAFAVASQVDSRTILDQVGAERLIGSGDMLFEANNGGKSTRIQGAFLSEEEVNRVVNVVKETYLHEGSVPQGLAMFDLWTDDSEDDFTESKPNPDEKRDDLYDSIKEFVLRHQEMSASMIQRKFEIGYPRAGRIVDQLERDGVVGPADGPKPRKVLGNGNRE